MSVPSVERPVHRFVCGAIVSVLRRSVSRAPPAFADGGPALDKRIGKIFAAPFLHHRNHSRHQPIRARRIAPVLVALRPDRAHVAGGHGASSKPAVCPVRADAAAKRDARNNHDTPRTSCSRSETDARGRRNLPRRIRAHVHRPSPACIVQRSLEHKSSGIGHDRAWRAQQRRTMRHARHVEHERREHVSPRAQVRREIEALVEMMVDISLRRTASDEPSVADKTDTGCRPTRAPRVRRVRVRHLEGSAKQSHLIMRRRRGSGGGRGVRSLRGPDPGSALNER